MLCGLDCVLVGLKVLIQSPWTGFLFNLVAVASLYLAVQNFQASTNVREASKELNRKALLVARGPDLLDRLRTSRKDLNTLITSTDPDVSDIHAVMREIRERVISLDEKMSADGTHLGKKITAEKNSFPQQDVKNQARRRYTQLAGFIVKAEEAINDQKQSLI